MYSIKFNPVIILAASFLAFISGKKIYAIILGSSQFGIYFIWNFLIFTTCIIAICLFVFRNHVTIDNTSISIRENVFRRPVTILLPDIHEVVYGTQDWGTWTKGRKVITIKKTNGEEKHFFSAGWLSKSNRVELFKKLSDLGVATRMNA